MQPLYKSIIASMALFASFGVFAQEAAIRKNLVERLPQIKQVDEVNKSAVDGIYEVRVNGTDILYTDAQANFLFAGKLIDLKGKRDLTEERINKLVELKFKDLPLKDAFTIVRGNGQRKLAVFEDPNCGYCKRFERDLLNVDNVTVYMFLYPILGAESLAKSKSIWCAKDQAKAWQDWMVRDQHVQPAAEGCDSAALTRNVDLGRRHKITGTPTLIFADDSRVPGAVDSKRVEKLLGEIKG